MIAKKQKVALILSASVVAVLAGAAGVAASNFQSGMTFGEFANELRGNTQTRQYDTGADVPDADRPDWMPLHAADVTVKKPGTDDGASTVKLDFSTASALDLPDECATETRYVQPFDGGGRWPQDVLEASHDCGDWRVSVTEHHVYAWRD